jgi:4-hydroxy-tetrahydrodipicolinate synthase
VRDPHKRLQGAQVSDHFRGSYTVTVTPFSPDGSKIDLDATRGFIDWQLDAGVPGLVVLGTTGEYLAVSDRERDELVEAVVSHVAGRIPVLVGASSAYTPSAVRFARRAEEQGADGLMISPPYYYTPTEPEIRAYYAAICDAVALPVMLYNNPVTTNVDMSAELVAELTRSLDNVRYIKEASLDIARVHEIVELTEGEMQVFAGEQIVASFLLGAVGYVNPFGNYVPRASSRIWDLLVAGRVDEARRIERKLDEINAVIAAGHPTYGHQCYSKALAAALGHPVGDVREPLTTFTALGEEGHERVARIVPIVEAVEALVDEVEAGDLTAGR